MGIRKMMAAGADLWGSELKVVGSKILLESGAIVGQIGNCSLTTWITLPNGFTLTLSGWIWNNNCNPVK